MILRNKQLVSKCIKRYQSFKFPDSAPRTADNQSWLDHLERLKLTLGLKNFESRPVKNFLHDRNNTRFPVTTEPLQDDSNYITTKASLANFTSMKYIKPVNKKQAASSNFVDLRIVNCCSGKGGDGIVSFFRDAGHSIGPPDGGDGGDGGSVYVQAVEGINSLAKLRSIYRSGDGVNGAAGQLDGARGNDILITVPVGTVVKWSMNPAKVRNLINRELKKNPNKSQKQILDTTNVNLKCLGEYRHDDKPEYIQLFRDGYEPGQGWIFKDKSEQFHNAQEWFSDLNKKVTVYDMSLFNSELDNDKFPLFGIDLSTPTERPICLLKGGKGGLGNMHFLTQLIRNPRFAKKGRAGLEQHFIFELKTIADLGLVGFPNAGKSTILNKISNANSRIGHWKFTTLSPTVGTINLGLDKPSFTVADIPGIIENASQDKGMGLEFLRHIERSKGWVFVLSLEEDPLKQLDILINELGGMETLRKRNVLIVCNKADIDTDGSVFRNKFMKVQEFCELMKWDCLPISALENQNIDLLIQKMAHCAGKA